MARKRRVSISLLTVVLVFCRVELSYMIYTAQTPTQVIDMLSFYSSPMNYTMGKRFLQDVRKSEAGLCLNLSSSQNTSAAVKNSLVSLHLRRTNQSSVTNATFKFPCLECSTFASMSALAEPVVRNTTLTNVSCLALSRFSEDFAAVVGNPQRLSDVLSLSLYDPQNNEFVNLSRSDTVNLQIPLAKAPNNSYRYVLECLSQNPSTYEWSNASCWTNQTLKVDNGTSLVQCRCSTLGSFAVFVKYFENGSSPSENLNVNARPRTRLSLTLDAGCERYLSNATIKADFLNTTKYTIAAALNTSVSMIQNVEAYCGSIIVNFTLVSHDGTNQTLNSSILKFGRLITTDSFNVLVNNMKLYPFSLRNIGMTIPGVQTFISPYYYRKFATQPTTPKSTVQPLVTDFKPFFIAVAVVLSAIVFCVCFSCFSHSWYLRKKKYTEFNSERVVPKVEEPVEKVEEEAPPDEFPMTYAKRPKVDERQMARYDWARTSFAQEQTDVSAFVTPQAGLGPRLIVDCDSDDESEGNPAAEDASVSIDMGDGSEVGSESEDDDGYAERGTNLSGSVNESVPLVSGSQASLLPKEDNVQSGSEEDGKHVEEGVDNHGMHDECEIKDEGEADGAAEDKEECQDSAMQNEDEKEPEGNNDRSMEDDEAGDEPRQEDEPEEKPRHDEETTEERRQDDEDNERTNEDPEGSPGTERRAESARSRGASLRLSGATPPSQGMPEPSM